MTRSVCSKLYVAPSLRIQPNVPPSTLTGFEDVVDRPAEVKPRYLLGMRKWTIALVCINTLGGV